MPKLTFDQERTFFSVNEVAEIKEVTPEAIRLAIKRGKLRSTKIRNTHFISKVDCDAYEPVIDPSDRAGKRWPNSYRPSENETPF